MPESVLPKLTALSPDQIQYIHARSLEILKRTGVRIDSPRARRILAQAEGVQWVSEDRVLFQPDLVEWAIQTAPAAVDLFDRRGQLSFRLGDDRTRFGIGVTNLYYQDPLNDAIEPFTRRHMALSARLGNQLPHYDVISTIGILQDYPPESADLYAVLEMAANTTKPLVILISDEGLFPRALDLLEHLHGDLATRPFVVPYFNPITPLVINEGTGDKLLEAVERGLPVIYSNYSMAGMSTPITAAGTLVLMNAELLAGLTLAQLARPGAPVILGSLPAYFDMRSMQDFYDPHSMLINLACAEMMAHYDLPHAGTSGSGIGWGADLAAASLLWMNHLTSLLGRSGLAPFVGGNLGSKAFSPALAVYSHEIIEQALRLSRGFPLDDESVDLEEIVRRGPGGSFLEADLTMKLFRQAYHQSKIFPRIGLEKWEERGQPQGIDLLRQHTQNLLDTSQPPEDHDELITKGEAFIQYKRSQDYARK
jgi:trimethylamine--corrinoid protein Co-methyltransferase